MRNVADWCNITPRLAGMQMLMHHDALGLLWRIRAYSVECDRGGPESGWRLCAV